MKIFGFEVVGIYENTTLGCGEKAYLLVGGVILDAEKLHNFFIIDDEVFEATIIASQLFGLRMDIVISESDTQIILR